MERCTENKILSEVHMHVPGKPAAVCGNGLTVSRFIFRIPKALESSFLGHCPEPQHQQTDGTTGHQETGAESDQDGDLILHRPTSAATNEAVVTIVHAMETDLKDVGQQVWLGALLLCDFLLHTTGLLDGATVLDLGAGVGLTTLVAALTAKVVFCTDYDERILWLAQQNLQQNSLLPLKAKFCVRELNLMDEDPLEVKHEGQTQSKEPFQLTAADLKILRQSNVILAAEVVYDEDLTDALFRVLYDILATPPSKVVFMTVEKRLVFTTMDFDVVSPAYMHFCENLSDLGSVDDGPVRFVCSRIDTSFPQYFQYQRTKELELWKIETLFPNG